MENSASFRARTLWPPGNRRPHGVVPLFLLSVVLLGGCAEKSKDVVILRVNGQEVCRSELELLARSGMNKAGITPGSAESQEWLEKHVENLYDSLVRLYLIQQAAQATQQEPTDEEINQAIQEFFPDRKQYAEFMEAMGLSPGQLRVILRDKIMADRFQAAKLEEGRKEPTQEDLRVWYDNHAAEFRAPARLRARHILFLVKPDSSPEERIAIKDHAEQVRRSLAGADEETFGRVARERSDDAPTAPQGGDLGFVSYQTARQLYPAGLADSLFKLRNGEISPVLQSSLGYHIFMAVDDHQEFEEAVEDVRERVVEESMVTSFLTWLAEARRNAKIEILVKPQELVAEERPDSAE